MAATPEQRAAAVALGLRVALATTLCLFLTELSHLRMTSLSVYSAHLVMAQFTFSAFQKGIERIVGRVLGVAYGLGLIAFFREWHFVYVALTFLGLLGFFYVYAANRLGYAALNGGLFVGNMAAIGMSAPDTAWSSAASLVQQIVLGVSVAFIVNFATGGERTVALVTTGAPFFPINRAWLSRAALLAVTQLTGMFVALVLDLPLTPTLISATILATSTDPTAMKTKAVQRAQGAFLGGGFALASMVLIVLMPHLLLLLALLGFWMFVSAYLVRVSPTWSYVGLQMGLVMPMVLIGDSDQLGSFSAALNRVLGVAVGFVVSEAIWFLWPHPTPSATIS